MHQRPKSGTASWRRWLVVGAVGAACTLIFVFLPVHTYEGSTTTLASLFVEWTEPVAESGVFGDDVLAGLFTLVVLSGPLAVFAPAVVAVEWGWGVRSTSWRVRTALGLQAVLFVASGFGLLAIIYLNGTQLTFGPTDPPRGVTYWNVVYAVLVAVAAATLVTGWLAATDH